MMLASRALTAITPNRRCCGSISRDLRCWMDRLINSNPMLGSVCILSMHYNVKVKPGSDSDPPYHAVSSSSETNNYFCANILWSLSEDMILLSFNEHYPGRKETPPILMRLHVVIIWYQQRDTWGVIVRFRPRKVCSLNAD